MLRTPIVVTITLKIIPLHNTPRAMKGCFFSIKGNSISINTKAQGIKTPAQKGGKYFSNICTPANIQGAGTISAPSIFSFNGAGNSSESNTTILTATKRDINSRYANSFLPRYFFIAATLPHHPFSPGKNAILLVRK